MHGCVACLVLRPCLVGSLFTGLSVFTIKKARDPDACALGFGFAPDDEPGRMGFWVPCWCYNRPFQSVSTLPCLLPSCVVWKWSQQVHAPSTVSPVPCLCSASGFHAPRREAVGARKKVIQCWGDWFPVISLPLWLLQGTPGVLWWYTVSFLLALALPEAVTLFT